MTAWLTGGWWLLAQEGAARANPLLDVMPILPIAVMVMLYIMLVHRPQRREQAVRQAMLANLKKNDHVLTTGGIYGVVTNVRSDADEVTIRVDESSNTRLRITRGAIAKVISDQPPAASEPA